MCVDAPFSIRESDSTDFQIASLHSEGGGVITDELKEAAKDKIAIDDALSSYPHTKKY